MSKLRKGNIDKEHVMYRSMVNGPYDAEGTIDEMIKAQQRGEFSTNHVSTSDIINAQEYAENKGWHSIGLRVETEWLQDTGDEVAVTVFGKVVETDAQLAKRQREHDARLERERKNDEKALKKIKKRNPDLLGVSDE
jgi:hypothetical protein